MTVHVEVDEFDLANIIYYYVVGYKDRIRFGFGKSELLQQWLLAERVKWKGFDSGKNLPREKLVQLSAQFTQFARLCRWQTENFSEAGRKPFPFYLPFYVIRY